jgi:transketolase C-terminal domain/subunit
MDKESKSGVIGAILIGVGCGLAAAGLAVVIPVCANWSARRAQEAIRKGRERMEDAAAAFGEVAGRAQQRFGEAAKAARQKTSKAAGAVETAARRVREYTESESA